MFWTAHCWVLLLPYRELLPFDPIWLPSNHYLYTMFAWQGEVALWFERSEDLGECIKVWIVAVVTMQVDCYTEQHTREYTCWIEACAQQPGPSGAPQSAPLLQMDFYLPGSFSSNEKWMLSFSHDAFKCSCSSKLYYSYLFTSVFPNTKQLWYFLRCPENQQEM